MPLTIDQAYITLGLEPALEFEARRLRELHFRSPGSPFASREDIVDFTNPTVRRVGSTTRMLVMAALDGLEGRGVAVEVSSAAEQRNTRTMLQSYIRKLGGGFSEIGRIVVVTRGSRRDTPTDLIIFTDHFRDALFTHDQRVLGPLGWARSCRQIAWGSHAVFDQTGALIQEVTDAGLATLRDRHCVEIATRW